MRKDALVHGLTALFPYTFREAHVREKSLHNGMRNFRCASIADKYHVALLTCFSQDDSAILDVAFCDRVRCATSLFFHHECLRLQINIHSALGHALVSKKKFPRRAEEYLRQAAVYEQVIWEMDRIYNRIMNEIEDCIAEEVIPEAALVLHDVAQDPIAFYPSFPFPWQPQTSPMEYTI